MIHPPTELEQPAGDALGSSSNSSIGNEPEVETVGGNEANHRGHFYDQEATVGHAQGGSL